MFIESDIKLLHASFFIYERVYIVNKTNIFDIFKLVVSRHNSHSLELSVINLTNFN